MAGRFDSILGTVGNTPVVRINHLAPEGVELYVKVEAFNPMGSVKDRLALGVIEDAERSGALKPGQTVIEPPNPHRAEGDALQPDIAPVGAAPWPRIRFAHGPFSPELA